MQGFQFIGFWVFNLVDWKGQETILDGPVRYKGVVVYTALLVMTVIVPLLSIGHYYLKLKTGVAHQEENKIKIWLMIYPLIGFLMFLQYIFSFKSLAID